MRTSQIAAPQYQPPPDTPKPGATGSNTRYSDRSARVRVGAEPDALVHLHCALPRALIVKLLNQGLVSVQDFIAADDATRSELRRCALDSCRF